MFHPRFSNVSFRGWNVPKVWVEDADKILQRFFRLLGGCNSRLVFHTYPFEIDRECAA